MKYSLSATFLLAFTLACGSGSSGGPDSDVPLNVGEGCDVGDSAYVLVRLDADSCGVCIQWEDSGELDALLKDLPELGIAPVTMDYSSEESTLDADTCAGDLGMTDLYTKYQGTAGPAILIGSDDPNLPIIEIDPKLIPTAEAQLDAIKKAIGK